MASRWREFMWKKGNDWFGYLHRVAGRGENEGNLELYPAWGRIGVTLGSLAILSYAGLATGIWYHMHNTRGYASISWNDVAWPWNWKEMRYKQGNELIASVNRLFELQRFQQGLFNLIAGVRMAPDNLEGRSLLAAIQSELGRKDLSAETLAEGLDYAKHELEFIGAVFQANLATQNEERVVELAKKWFERPERDAPTDKVVLFAYAAALGNLRHPEEAIRVILQSGLANDDTGVLLISQTLWINDRREDAVQVLERGLIQYPKSDQMYVRLFQYQRMLGRMSAAELTLASRALANPDSHEAAVDLIWWYADQGKQRQLELDIESYLRRFTHNQPAMASLTTGASARGLVDLVERCVALAQKNGWNTPVFSLMRVEAHVAAKRYAEAASMLDTLSRSKADWLEQFEVPMMGYGAVANLAGGNPINGEATFVQLMSRQRISATELNTIARRFTEAGLTRYARRIYNRSLEVDPANNLALAALIELEVRERNTDAVPDIVDRLLLRRRPGLPNLTRVQDALSSDFATFVPSRDERLERVTQRIAALKLPQPLESTPNS